MSLCGPVCAAVCRHSLLAVTGGMLEDLDPVAQLCSHHALLCFISCFATGGPPRGHVHGSCHEVTELHHIPFARPFSQPYFNPEPAPLASPLHRLRRTPPAASWPAPRAASTARPTSSPTPTTSTWGTRSRRWRARRCSRGGRRCGCIGGLVVCGWEVSVHVCVPARQAGHACFCAPLRLVGQADLPPINPAGLYLLFMCTRHCGMTWPLPTYYRSIVLHVAVCACCPTIGRPTPHPLALIGQSLCLPTLACLLQPRAAQSACTKAHL